MGGIYARWPYDEPELTERLEKPPERFAEEVVLFNEAVAKGWEVHTLNHPLSYPSRFGPISRDYRYSATLRHTNGRRVHLERRTAIEWQVTFASTRVKADGFERISAAVFAYLDGDDAAAESIAQLCPNCGAVLYSQQTRQCLDCGTNWHHRDPL